ncbi:PIN domain-containing protein [Sphingomonas sp.]|uniref:PIN domain-containing protein n=1 Tax=Sphingomonas sp. TaxID=28214 RepID=UPI003CC5CDD5
MALLLDTDVAVHIRDGQRDIIGRVVARSAPLFLSSATLIELTGGVYARPELSRARREGLQSLLRQATPIVLDDTVIGRYDGILRVTGFSRAKVFDRVIAATAIAHDLTLVTINGADFREIPGLKLEVWPAPAQ